MPVALAASLYQQGRYAETADMLLASFAGHAAPGPQAFSLLARALANQGKLAEALVWCDRWVAATKLDASGHYLRAVILQELGDNEPSRRSLQRAIYLDSDFVLAHFALGNLARNCGKVDQADKHFTNALRLLRGCQPNDLLPERVDVFHSSAGAEGCPESSPRVGRRRLVGSQPERRIAGIVLPVRPGEFPRRHALSKRQLEGSDRAKMGRGAARRNRGGHRARI